MQETRRLLGLSLIVALVATAGCLTAVQDAARDAFGDAETEFRPADPTKADYVIRAGDGLLAPHAMRYEGAFERAVLSGLDVRATTTRLEVRDLFEDVYRRWEQPPVPRPTTDARPDPWPDDDAERTAGSAYGQDDGRVRLLLVNANATLLTDNGTMELTTMSLLVNTTAGPLVAEGDLALAGSGRFVHDGSTVRADPAGYPIRVPSLAAPMDTMRSSVSAGPDWTWIGANTLSTLGAVTLPGVQVAWSVGDPADDVLGRAVGTLIIGADQTLLVGAPALQFTPSTFAVADPPAPRFAASGLRSSEPLGLLEIVTASEGASYTLRDEAVKFDRAIVAQTSHVSEFDASPGALRFIGAVVQVEEGTRPAISAEVALDHPSADPDGSRIELRVPPGETFRTMLGVREVSGVGSATGILVTNYDSLGDVEVNIDTTWHDERVFDEGFGANLGEIVGTVARFFVEPDGLVTIGPNELAWLPVSFKTDADGENATEVGLRIHPRNANVVNVTVVLVPDADAATSDVESRSPGPGFVLVAVAGLLLAAALRRPPRVSELVT